MRLAFRWVKVWRRKTSYQQLLFRTLLWKRGMRPSLTLAHVVTRPSAQTHFPICVICENLWFKVLLFSPSPLEIVTKSPAGAEVAVGNLKNLRGDRPGIVVIEAVH